MEETTRALIVVLARLIIGFLLIVLNALTGIDGQIVLVGLFLMGVPIEAFIRPKAETKAE